METITLATNKITKDSIVDGDGIRTVLWVQGCHHHCPGCHNPQTHNYLGGETYPIEDIAEELARHLKHTDLTLSGGEPFNKVGALVRLIRKLRTEYNFQGNIWCYTGYTIEEIHSDTSMQKLLNEIDVLVDGKFIEELKVLDIPFKGSSNQRIIDIKSTVTKGEVVLYFPK